jgi:hypothetical protein
MRGSQRCGEPDQLQSSNTVADAGAYRVSHELRTNTQLCANATHRRSDDSVTHRKTDTNPYTHANADSDLDTNERRANSTTVILIAYVCALHRPHARPHRHAYRFADGSHTAASNVVTDTDSYPAANGRTDAATHGDALCSSEQAAHTSTIGGTERSAHNNAVRGTEQAAHNNAVGGPERTAHDNAIGGSERTAHSSAVSGSKCSSFCLANCDADIDSERLSIGSPECCTITHSDGCSKRCADCITDGDPFWRAHDVSHS